MKLKIPKYKSDKELFNFLVANKQELIQQKKSQKKKVKASFHIKTYSNKIKKSEVSEDENGDKYIDRKCIINTCCILDTHRDVHIPKLWNNSLKQNSRILHVQEHKSNKFKNIISSGEDLSCYVKNYSWRDLGLDVDGKTEALEFDSRIRKSRNKFMFKQYKKGYVTEHSVGMYYVKIVLCINDEDYGAEYEAYQKYYKYIINKEDVSKYFWAVTEAKVIEGSAVPLGSNPITPTMSNKSNKKTKNKKLSKKQKKKLKLKKQNKQELKQIKKWLNNK